MNAKWVTGATAALGLLLAGAASAHGNGKGNGFAYGRVVDVQPVVRYVTVSRPRRECWEDVEYRSDRPARIAGTTAAGGIIGAAIGRQFGDGRGRDALTVIGGVVGSAVANDRARRNTRDDLHAVAVERCQTVNDTYRERVIDAYDVTYRYRGRLYTMRTHEHPGDRVRLAVDVRPARYRY